MFICVCAFWSQCVCELISPTCMVLFIKTRQYIQSDCIEIFTVHENLQVFTIYPIRYKTLFWFIVYTRWLLITHIHHLKMHRPLLAPIGCESTILRGRISVKMHIYARTTNQTQLIIAIFASNMYIFNPIHHAHDRAPASGYLLWIRTIIADRIDCMHPHMCSSVFKLGSEPFVPATSIRDVISIK